MNFEIPADFSVPLHWKLGAMERGDELLVEGRSVESVRTTVSKYGRRTGKVFRVSKKPDGSLVERVI